MKKLYIVEGESSIGAEGNDNRITWLVRAYDSKQDAYDHADSAEKFSMDNFKKKIPNPWDSQMSKASVSVYNVVECDYSTN
jgi:hypothetical protein